MKLIDSLVGTGRIQVWPDQSSDANYSIDLWTDSDGLVFGRGEIAGSSETLSQASSSSRPVPLVLADGRRLPVTVIERVTDDAWAVICLPLAPFGHLQAAWPAAA